MTVNIYDDVNKLEATFRKTEEYAAFEAAITAIKEDEEALKLFKDFRDLQLNLQEQQMQGTEISQEALEAAQEQAIAAQSNEKIMAMFEAEMKLSNIVEEINRVVMKPVQTLYSQL